MDKIVLFDTSCGSLNLGDYIICDSVERELAPLLNKNIVFAIQRIHL